MSGRLMQLSGVIVDHVYRVEAVPRAGQEARVLSSYMAAGGGFNAMVAARRFGMEVIYAGLRRTPEDIARIVLEEDADVLGLSILSGAVVPLTRRVLEALKALEVDDVVLVVGGIVPDPARAELNGMGVPGVFTPGTSLTEIVKFIESSVKLDRDYGEKQ